MSTTPQASAPGRRPPIIRVGATEFDRRTGRYRALARSGTKVVITDRWGRETEILTRAELGASA